eukprot:TRINITY_DN4321_c0_g1_i1.p1 TRINITY_DN4321_c0_g1~~TRINITY_DN4321_c0_g1_i1.p1  ORF type:complete len:568 (-),score=161.83 TRINITY_DN4321_c0_g1_i1:251-1954(-)
MKRSFIASALILALFVSFSFAEDLVTVDVVPVSPDVVAVDATAEIAQVVEAVEVIQVAQVVEAVEAIQAAQVNQVVEAADVAPVVARDPASVAKAQSKLEDLRRQWVAILEATGKQIAELQSEIEKGSGISEDGETEEVVKTEVQPIFEELKEQILQAEQIISVLQANQAKNQKSSTLYEDIQKIRSQLGGMVTKLMAEIESAWNADFESFIPKTKDLGLNKDAIISENINVDSVSSEYKNMGYNVDDSVKSFRKSIEAKIAQFKKDRAEAIASEIGVVTKKLEDSAKESAKSVRQQLIGKLEEKLRGYRLDIPDIIRTYDYAGNSDFKQTRDRIAANAVASIENMEQKSVQDLVSKIDNFKASIGSQVENKLREMRNQANGAADNLRATLDMYRENNLLKIIDIRNMMREFVRLEITTTDQLRVVVDIPADSLSPESPFQTNFKSCFGSGDSCIILDARQPHAAIPVPSQHSKITWVSFEFKNDTGCTASTAPKSAKITFSAKRGRVYSEIFTYDPEIGGEQKLAVKRPLLFVNKIDISFEKDASHGDYICLHNIRLGSKAHEEDI